MAERAKAAAKEAAKRKKKGDKKKKKKKWEKKVKGDKKKDSSSKNELSSGAKAIEAKAKVQTFLKNLNIKKAHFKDMDEIVALVVIEEDSSAEDDRSPEEIRAQEDRSWRFKQILDKKISLSEQSDFIHKLLYNKHKKGQEDSAVDIGKASAKQPKEALKKVGPAKEESEDEKEEFSEEEEESERSEESEEDIKAKSAG